MLVFRKIFAYVLNQWPHMWWLRERIYILVDSRQEFTETTNQSFSWKLFIWVFWKETSVILNDFTITSKSRLFSRLGFSEIELLFNLSFLYVCIRKDSYGYNYLPVPPLFIEKVEMQNLLNHILNVWKDHPLTYLLKVNISICTF